MVKGTIQRVAARTPMRPNMFKFFVHFPVSVVDIVENTGVKKV